MRLLIMTIVGASLIGAASASAGGLTEAGELEHARANARAGGPVSERDAELLDRYGCLSGTRSRFCEQREYRQHRERRRWRD